MAFTRLLFVALILTGSSLAKDRTHQEWKTEFSAFMQTYNRMYRTNEEFQKRFAAFKDNMVRADELNEANPSATFGATKFADLTADEFEAKYLGYKKSSKSQLIPPSTLNLPTEYQYPASFDWNSKGAVTPVYNQEACGSCWAFSTTEAIESAWFLAGNSLVSLSPQQIVDCDQGNGDEGCNGGDTTTAYQYVIKAGGLESWNDYPYAGYDQSCAFQSKEVVAKISGWSYVTQNKNETEMLIGLMEKGPLSICVDASSWQVYIGGVVSALCGDDLDHCVQITGYQDVTDIFGTYHVWNIRNSWGADWGEDGYIWVERGSDLCGVGDEVTVAVV
eukprot:TRINITY_DN454_c0_g1_i1.p1 TRINITY_DN454_c0_g1~~TRINITY_DN454_c0_g1_i1.p1  ORF type:complete len:333 (+),score=72.61 TRINITY_DN454_c0_g1_i1:44-1042(+)